MEDSARPTQLSGAPLANTDTIAVRNLLVRNIIGVDNWERKKKQDIVINLQLHFDITSAGRAAPGAHRERTAFSCRLTRGPRAPWATRRRRAPGEHDDVRQTLDYANVTKAVADFAEATQFKSVEGLAEGIAQLCLAQCGVPALTVRVEKPRALLNASAAGVEITRSRDWHALRPLAAEPTHRFQQDDQGVYHAYGSRGRGRGGRRARESHRGPRGICRRLTSRPVRRGVRVRGRSHVGRDDCIFISGLRVRTIVGVNPAEREEPQDIIAYLYLWSSGRVRLQPACTVARGRGVA